MYIQKIIECIYIKKCIYHKMVINLYFIKKMIKYMHIIIVKMKMSKHLILEVNFV